MTANLLRNDRFVSRVAMLALGSVLAAIFAYALVSISTLTNAATRATQAFTRDEARSLTPSSRARHRDALRAVAELLATQRTIARVAPPVAIVGLGSVAALAFVLLRSRRRVGRALARDLERLNVAAFVDNLTGLGNHRAFQEAIVIASRGAKRDGASLALALLDVDDFKIVNDRFGHARGDRVLQILGESLAARLGPGRGYRIGGDEFAIVLEGLGVEAAVALVERLRADLVRARLGSTISVGVAGYDSGASVDILQERADAALYEAKRRGRDRVVAFDAIADVVSIYTSAKVNALRRIVAENSVSVVFQPIVDILSSTVLGYEALSRFTGDADSPETSEAFDIAERIGRSYDLDDVCLAAIFARASELPKSARLFVNVSPQTLDHESFARRLDEAASRADIAPNRIVVELTERSMERPLTVIREANRLRAAGFRLALDDVGSGNAGLALLGSLSVEFIKIDRAVVSAAASGRVGRAVYAGIIAIARENGSYVIAEGIEDDEMLHFARRTRGVHGVQGYHLGRPAQTPQPPRRVALVR